MNPQAELLVTAGTTVADSLDPTMLAAEPLPAINVGPVTARGKFLYLGDEKFFIRGATYGAFPPNADGDQFPEPAEAIRDLVLMREAGINTILTYTVPPL